MTILGQHSVEDLQDLVKSTDYSVNTIQKTYDGFAADWKSKDPLVHADWLTDWTMLRGRYKEAREKAAKGIQAAELLWNIRNSVIPAEPRYQDILVSLHKDPKGPYVKGDLQDLYNRFADAQKKPIIFNQPQPTGSDVDLLVYSGADKTIKAGETAAKEAKKAVEEAAKANPLWVAGGIAIGLGALAVVLAPTIASVRTAIRR